MTTSNETHPDSAPSTADPLAAAVALDLLPVGVAICDEQGVVLRVNAASELLTGSASSALEGRPITEWTFIRRDRSEVPPHAAPPALVLATRHEVAGVELGLRRTDGEVVWLDISASPLPAGGAVLTFSDVSRRHREEAIAAARARLSELAVGVSLEAVLRATLDEIEQLTDSSIGFYHFVEADENALTLQAWSTKTTEVFCRAVGYGMQYPVSEAGVWVDAVRARQPVVHNDYASLPHRKGMPEGHAHVERELIVPVIRGGRVVAVLGTGNKPRPYDDGDVDLVQRFADLAWDLAEWKRAEESLSIKDAAIAFSLTGMVITDLELKITDVNDAALAMWSISRDEAVGRHAADFMDDSPEKIVEKVVREGSATGTATARRPDGTTFYVEYSAALLRDVAGRPARIAATVIDVTERRAQEHALRESEAQLRRLIMQSPLPKIVANPSGEITHLNEAFVRMFGFDLDDLPTVDSWFGKLIPDEEHRRLVTRSWRESFEESRRTGQTTSLEYEVVCKDGTHRIVERNGAVIGDSWVAVFSDVTEARRLQEKLSVAAGRFKTLVNTALDGFMAIAGGRIIDVNETYAHMVGYSVSELLTMTLTEVEAREDPAEVARHLEQIARVGYDRFETLHRTRTGKTLPVEVSAMHDGASRGILAFVRDLRQQKAAEEQLRESNRFLREAQRAGRAGTYVWDLRTDEWKSSPELDEIFGIGAAYPRTLAGWSNLVAPEWRERMAAYVGEIMASNHPFDQQYMICRQSTGDLRWVHGMGELERDAAGVPLRLLGVIQDITERKKADEELSQTREQLFRSQKMESLGVLAGGVAHDINNVLAAILGLSSAYGELEPPGTPLRDALDTITNACVRGRTTVRALLGFARLELAEERLVDLNPMVHDEVKLLERITLGRISLICDTEPMLWPIKGDPGALSNALMNLCVNAIDAMPDGGELTLRTRNVAPATVELMVGDTGRGMAPDVVDRAFDPFFTTKPQGSGTGLGLSIVYGAARAHGGEVAIESAVGEGTRVVLRFPALVQEQVGAAAVEAPTPPAAPSIRILLVDDDDDVRNTTALLLTRLKHVVTTASSGEQAIELLESGAEADLVLLDLGMPGVGGAGALKRIRSMRPLLPVLISTGLADQRALDLTETYPHVKLLQKPFTLRELRAMLDEIPASAPR